MSSKADNQANTTDPYIFYGLVLPERAPLTLTLPPMTFTHSRLDMNVVVTVNIRLNQVVIWAESEDEWPIFDLRNVVRTLVQNYLSIVGYIRGFAYDLEITRALHRGRNVDVVFGIDIPCLAERQKKLDLFVEFLKAFNKVNGKFGIYLNRCFNDLSSAMRNANDTAFYCYRAIESLRNHCSAVHGMDSATESKRWDKFRSVASCDEATIRRIKGRADPVRHGRPDPLSDEERQEVFLSTWDIVDRYMKTVKPNGEK